MDWFEPRNVADPAAVERELTALWRGGEGSEPVTRACSLNLIVVCDDGEDDVRETTMIVARVAEDEPGRTLLIAQPGGEGNELDVQVSANCHRDSNQRVVCSEQISLRARGEGRSLVPHTALQLLVEDLPVYVWWRRRHLRRDPLLYPLREMADRLIVDTARFARPGHGLHALRAVATDPAWPGEVLDLAWMRQEPWRESLASLFDLAARREALASIRRVEVVSGGPRSSDGLSSAAAFLVGWLASRLGWRRADEAWHGPAGGRIEIELGHDDQLDDGELHAVRIEAQVGGRPFHGFVERTERLGRLVRVGHDEGETRTIGFPRRDDAAILCGTLQRGLRDPIFIDALRAAAEMADP